MAAVRFIRSVDTMTGIKNLSCFRIEGGMRFNPDQSSPRVLSSPARCRRGLKMPPEKIRHLTGGNFQDTGGGTGYSEPVTVKYPSLRIEFNGSFLPAFQYETGNARSHVPRGRTGSIRYRNPERALPVPSHRPRDRNRYRIFPHREQIQSRQNPRIHRYFLPARTCPRSSGH